MDLLSRYRGCLLGGAVGDALGYAVEFMSWDRIRSCYGERGITYYDLCQGRAIVSDDTQMTLFTATALLSSATHLCRQGRLDPGWGDYLWLHYKDWLKTQEGGNGRSCSWLTAMPVLNVCRAPGGTCLSALRGARGGSLARPINDSKGCGGVMRVAPIGLFCGRHLIENEQGSPCLATLQEADLLGAEAAALTHGHELGYIPAACLVHLVARAAHGPWTDLESIVREACAAMAEQFSGKRHLKAFLDLIDRAQKLARTSGDDREAIAQLGEGWVAEETLAIAIYCSLKYSYDFESAIVAAVNHSGDSDSTGAVTGNILGAFLGLEAIPERWVEPLDCRDLLETVARDLCAGVPLPLTNTPAERERICAWDRKYVAGRCP